MKLRSNLFLIGFLFLGNISKANFEFDLIKEQSYKLLKENTFTNLSIFYVKYDPSISFIDKEYSLNLEKDISKEIKENKPQINSLFDLASITKIFTALLIMSEIEIGTIFLNTKVNKFFSNIENKITIKHLLNHSSGMPAGIYIAPNENSINVWDKIYNLKSNPKYFNAFRYSDVNYLLLGKILEKINNQKLDVLFKQKIFSFLGMNQSTMFFLNNNNFGYNNCILAYKKPCQVHDPTSRFLGGITGHAGIFSSIYDLKILGENILKTYFNKKPKTLISTTSLKEMLTANKQGRGLGFDLKSVYARRSTGNFSWSDQSFGHTGFTGTNLFFDPIKRHFLIILSNSVYDKNNNENQVKLNKKNYLKYLENVSTLIGKIN